MKTALVIAASFALTTTACFAGEDCKKSSCESKKSNVISKLFHKKAGDSKTNSKVEYDPQVAATNFITY